MPASSHSPNAASEPSSTPMYAMSTSSSTSLIAQLMALSGVPSERQTIGSILAPWMPPASLITPMATSPPMRSSGREMLPPSLLT